MDTLTNTTPIPDSSFTSDFPCVKEKFTTLEKIVAVVMVFLGYFFLKKAFIFGSGFGAGIFYTLLFAISSITVKKSGYTINLFSRISAIVIILFIANLFYTSNYFIRFMTALTVTAGIPIWLYCTTNEFTRIESYFGFDIITAVFGRFFSSFAKKRKAISSIFTDNRNLGKVKYIVTGLIFAVPLTLIIAGLLMSADARLNDIFEDIFMSFSDNFISNILVFLVSLPLSSGLFSYIHSAVHRDEYFNSDDRQSHKSQLALSFAKVNPIILCTAVTPICLLYILFFLIQLDYFVGAFFGKLPEGFSFSEYARSGFFQLCVIAILNAVIIVTISGLCSRLTDSSNNNFIPKIMKAYTIFLSISTLLLIVTAMSKMGLYVAEYGLTPLRVYSSWLMILLFFIFSFVIVKIINTKFKLSAVVTVTTILFLGLLCFSNTDSLIVEVNYALYTNGYIKDFDCNYLSSDAAPALYNLAVSENFDQASNAINHLETIESSDIYNSGISSIIGNSIVSYFN